MPGRTLIKHARVYYHGYDISGHSRGLGEFGGRVEEVNLAAITDAVVGALPGAVTIMAGPFNGLLDNTAVTGLHTLASGANDTDKLLTYALGDRAAPAQGDVAFSAFMRQRQYRARDEGGAVVVHLEFSRSIQDTSHQDPTPFGFVLNANVARTGANTASGVDNPTAGATAFGGCMSYHITAGNGTATLSVDDSADNAIWAALAGATTGVITAAAGVAANVYIGRTATVRRFLRWQLLLGTATSVTFVMAFNRNYS